MIIKHSEDKDLQCVFNIIRSTSGPIKLQATVSHEKICNAEGEPNATYKSTFVATHAYNADITKEARTLFELFINQYKPELTEVGSPLGNKPELAKEPSIMLTIHTFLCLMLASFRAQEGTALKDNNLRKAMACAALIQQAEQMQRTAYASSAIATPNIIERYRQAWVADLEPINSDLGVEIKTVFEQAHEFVKEQMN